MYGSKVGPAAATGLGAGAVSYNAGGWLWTLLAFMTIALVMLVVRPLVMRRRHAALGMVGNSGNTSWRQRIHVRRRR